MPLSITVNVNGKPGIENLLSSEIEESLNLYVQTYRLNSKDPVFSSAEAVIIDTLNTKFKEILINYLPATLEAAKTAAIAAEQSFESLKLAALLPTK